MKLEHKRTLRRFILEMLRDVSCVEIHSVAEETGCSSFDMAEQYGIELERIERLFNYPNYLDDE